MNEQILAILEHASSAIALFAVAVIVVGFVLSLATALEMNGRWPWQSPRPAAGPK